MLRYAGHPFVPVKLGFRRLLRVLNPELARLLQATDPYTLVPPRNRVTLYREALGVLERGVPGNFVEIGVHRGGTAGMLAHLLRGQPERALHLFDRWGDLPEPTPEDGERAEQYRKDRIAAKLRTLVEQPPLDDTRRVVEEVVGLDPARVVYHQGWYEETLDAERPEYTGEPIAFLSIDCDYYHSVTRALAFAARYAAPGAVLVVDDYGSWPGARRATEELLSRLPGVRVRRSALGQAILTFDEPARRPAALGARSPHAWAQHGAQGAR